MALRTLAFFVESPEAFARVRTALPAVNLRAAPNVSLKSDGWTREAVGFGGWFQFEGAPSLVTILVHLAKFHPPGGLALEQYVCVTYYPDGLLESAVIRNWGKTHLEINAEPSVPQFLAKLELALAAKTD